MSVGGNVTQPSSALGGWRPGKGQPGPAQLHPAKTPIRRTPEMSERVWTREQLADVWESVTSGARANSRQTCDDAMSAALLTARERAEKAEAALDAANLRCAGLEAALRDVRNCLGPSAPTCDGCAVEIKYALDSVDAVLDPRRDRLSLPGGADMTDRDSALSYLQEQMGEGWECEVEQEHALSWSARCWRGPGHNGGVEVSWSVVADPMSAARACVEAWREAAGPYAIKVANGAVGLVKQYGIGAVDKLADAAASALEAEREHADRLAEALRLVRARCPMSGETCIEVDQSLAAHAERRSGSGEGE